MLHLVFSSRSCTYYNYVDDPDSLTVSQWLSNLFLRENHLKIVETTTTIVETVICPHRTVMQKGTTQQIRTSDSAIRSEVAIPASPLPEIYEKPCDTLSVNIQSLRIPDENPKNYAIKVTYFDQLILNGIMKSIGARDFEENKIWVKGTMNYDPSDYEKMCFFADTPLIVNIQPLKSIDLNFSKQSLSSKSETLSKSNSIKSNSFVQQAVDTYCCNVDILPIFQGDEEELAICIRKRMEPMIKPSALSCKSWDCLPLLSMELRVTRHKDNSIHHKVLKESNWMKITLVAAYNMIIPYENEYMYTAASKTPLYCESNTGLATYNQGTCLPFRFTSTNFYPKWESLRVGEDLFTKGDEKFTCRLSNIQNYNNIELHKYLTEENQQNTVVWGSFHRSLLIKESSKEWLSQNIRIYKWPFEMHIYAEDGGYSFMAFLNLFPLLYPGIQSICIAVPLQWFNSGIMMEESGCQNLLTPNDKLPSNSPNMAVQKPIESRTITDSFVSTEGDFWQQNTGADENNAFAIIEIKLARPLQQLAIPKTISNEEINCMLKDIEESGPDKRECTGRGQLAKDWLTTVRVAATSLRRVPYYGTTDFYAFNRQLSEMRTRVELTTSCWQEAAVYVNNNFVVHQYLESDEIFEELRMMAHVCLVKLARDALLGDDRENKERDPILRAARQARQMQDTYHAMDLYLQLTTQKPHDANCWRELSTCLKDIDRDWANACLNKALVLDPRHPLTLVAKGGMVFEENPCDAEQFIAALLAYYPFWTTAWIVASAYYYVREHFIMADKILEIVKQSRREGLTEELGYARSWERELGDWWEFTPLLPGMTPFYDAADLLLRLRCVALAEVCMARALTYAGETSAYYHLVGLCCRLRGDYKESLCHIRIGLEKFGEIRHLRCLEAECLHQLGDIPGAMASYEKTTSHGAFTSLMSLPIYKEPQRIRAVLVDLIRRMPSAYAWMALAQDWMKKANNMKRKDEFDTSNVEEQTAAKTCAIACAVEALKWDRAAGSAWALLASLVKPSARRYHCIRMASLCGYKCNKQGVETNADSQQSLYYRLAAEITECCCRMCQNLRI